MKVEENVFTVTMGFVFPYYIFFSFLGSASEVTVQFPQGKLGSKGGQESSVSNISDTAKTPVVTPMTPKSPPKSNSSYSFLRPNGDNSTSVAKKASFAEPAATVAEVPPAAAASSLVPAISAGPLQGHCKRRDSLKLP